MPRHINHEHHGSGAWTVAKAESVLHSGDNSLFSVKSTVLILADSEDQDNG